MLFTQNAVRSLHTAPSTAQATVTKMPKANVNVVHLNFTAILSRWVCVSDQLCLLLKREILNYMPSGGYIIFIHAKYRCQSLIIKSIMNTKYNTNRRELLTSYLVSLTSLPKEEIFELPTGYVINVHGAVRIGDAQTLHMVCTYEICCDVANVV